MRYAEETVEGYWNSHSGTRNTVSYQTTPLYKGSENIPRGSVIDIKSSDNILNDEVIVVNSVEGIKINYNTGTSDAKDLSTSSTPVIHAATAHSRQNSNHSAPATKATSNHTKSSSSSVSNNSNSGQSYSTNGQWSVAASGMVFYRTDSNKYYSEVTNPNNYVYESQSAAVAAGGEQAPRGNQYARP